MKKNLKALFTVAITAVLMLTACSSNATPGNPGSNNGSTAESWLEAPSLKEAYVDGGIFDRFGFACGGDSRQICKKEHTSSCDDISK